MRLPPAMPIHGGELLSALKALRLHVVLDDGRAWVSLEYEHAPGVREEISRVEIPPPKGDR